MMIPLKVQHVWKQVPDSNCKGLCVESCGPIDASKVEKALLAERGIFLDEVNMQGVIAWLKGDPRDIPECPALMDGKCSVYDIRPLVCRLWGSVERLPCHWGCVPDGGHMKHEEARRLLEELGDGDGR